MLPIGRPYEVIVGDECFLGKIFEDGSALITEKFRFDAGFRRSSLDLQAVFVGARAENCPFSFQYPPSFEDIGKDQRVEVADMRSGIDVEYRRRDVEWFLR